MQVVRATVQIGTITGDGDLHQVAGGDMVQVQDILLLALVEVMAMVLEPGLGLDPGLVMDMVVEVLMVVVMEVVLATQAVEGMVVVEPIIGHLRSLRVKPTNHE